MSYQKTALRILHSTLFALFSLCSICSLYATISYPDFDKSMLRIGLGLECTDKEFNTKNLAYYRQRNQNMVSFFRDLYYRNIAAAAEDQKTLRIPRIIHQIWLGGPVPEVFYRWIKTWTDLEGWEYKLWTEKEIDDLFLYNRALYESSTNYGEKSDIIRLEILAQFGGVYADLDLECLQPEMFEELHHSFDFYIGFEPLEHGFISKFNMFKVCNAIVASAPHHPLIEDLVHNLRANYLAYKQCCNAVQRTGPSYLTRIICEHERSGAHRKRNIYLPCTFFYPVSEPEARYLFQHPEIPAIIAPETVGFHYWYGTWYKADPYSSNHDSIEKVYTSTPGTL